MTMRLALRAAALALCIAGALGGCSGLKQVPAHWVENADTLEPQRVRDFSFTGLSFAGPDVGWFVGFSNLLHLAQGTLELFLAEDLQFTTVKATGLHRVIASGSYLRAGSGLRSFGVIVHGDRGQWTAENLSAVPLNDWSISALDATDRSFILAVTDDTVGEPPRSRMDVLRGEAGVWTVLERPAGSRGWNLADVCIDETGGGWIVGSAESQTEAQRSLVLHYWDGALEDRTPPELAALDRVISRIECLPEGKLVMVAGPGRADPPFGESALMIRYDGTWHLDWLRPADSYSGVRGLAAVSDRDVWFASQRAGNRPIFLHWMDGVWTAVEPPVLPDGRTGGYAVTDMTFVSSDEGWATAIDSTGPGFRGLIFHYKDGVWRNRNWNWHFWDQPGFGLFGE